MSSRHQPANGADSQPTIRTYEQTPDWQPRPYSVLLEERFDGERIRTRINSAIGPKDAENQARDKYPGYVPLKAEETS